QVNRNKEQRIIRQRRKKLRCHNGIETTIHSGMPESLYWLALYHALIVSPRIEQCVYARQRRAHGKIRFHRF
ncbi:MAG TPA: hypothetical protein VF670_20655, partial [Duganella sp.]